MLSNEASKAFGHGRLHAANGSWIDIGGSTGGRTRKLLDNYVILSHEDFPTD